MNKNTEKEIRTLLLGIAKHKEAPIAGGPSYGDRLDALRQLMVLEQMNQQYRLAVKNARA